MRPGALRNFLTHDIWRNSDLEHSRLVRFFISKVKVTILAFRGFFEDHCQLRASALTFYTLLSIVPFVALLFGIAKGFQLHEALQDVLLQKMEGQEEIAVKVIQFSSNLLENTKGGLIAGIGVLVLLWTALKLLGNIERSFNSIWGIHHDRSLWRKISDYLAIVLICPFVIIFASSITVLLSSKIELFALLEHLVPVVLTSLKLLPLLLLWLMFTFVYVFLPNTRVRILPAFVGAIVAGTCFQLWQFLYINTQIFVGNYGAIYGSFSALPLFLLWLQVSWLIVLFGAEVAYALQNLKSFEQEALNRYLSPSSSKAVALRICQEVFAAFRNDNVGITADVLAAQLEVPVGIINEALETLCSSQVLVEAKSVKNGEALFCPAAPLEQLHVAGILQRLDHRGYQSEAPAVVDNKAFSKAREIMQKIETQREEHFSSPLPVENKSE